MNIVLRIKNSPLLGGLFKDREPTPSQNQNNIMITIIAVIVF